jgi:transposase
MSPYNETKKNETLKKIKEKCLEMFKSGESICHIASMTGVTRQTLYNWTKNTPVSDTGGRPGRLTIKEKNAVLDVIKGPCEPFGYESWTQRNIADYIKKTYGVEINYKSINSMLKII